MAILPYVIVLVKMLNSAIIFTIDTISSSQPLHDDGRTTLVSKDGTFELGVFTRVVPKPLYWNLGHLGLLGQNRDNNYLGGKFINKGLDSNCAAFRLGNLILRDEKDQNPQNYLWQSFDYPSDTYLPV
ncbi:hypothetical protein K1719_047215 [Acacia pycnantha]|nr:hypothetical protein K1719_047215 [Acacia pycnantha]